MPHAHPENLRANLPGRAADTQQLESEHTASPAQALTLAFTTFELFQLFNVFNARVEASTAFNSRFFNNRLLWAAVGGSLVLLILAVHWPPAQRLFDTTPLTPMQWALATGVASLILWLEEARKLLARVRRRPQ